MKTKKSNSKKENKVFITHLHIETSEGYFIQIPLTKKIEIKNAHK